MAFSPKSLFYAHLFNFSNFQFRSGDLVYGLTYSDELREAHKTLAEWRYELRPVERGYAGRTCTCNLSDQHHCRKTRDPKDERYLHGRQGVWSVAAVEWCDRTIPAGTALKMKSCIAGGPIGGITAYPGSGKCTVVTISPLTALPGRQQRRRLFWPVPEILRLGCAGNPGQGRTGCDRLHRWR